MNERTSEGAGEIDGIAGADFGRLQGHELADDLGTDSEHCIRCGFCTTACPVFEETKWESVSPRGHANVIAAYLDGELQDEEQFEENLDLCIKCKQCIAPCPAGVEIPKLVMRAHKKHREEAGTTIGDRLFAHPRRINRLGSIAAPISNVVGRLGPVRAVMESVLGIDARRPLPSFERPTLEAWFDEHRPAPAEGGLDRDVALFVDCYVNYNEPSVGTAAIKVLERMGVDVRLAENTCCGRAALSKGFVDEAEAYADEHIDYLVGLVDDGFDLVAVEPSCAAMLKDEYTDFYAADAVERLAANSYELMEYLDKHLDRSALDFEPVDRSIAVHSHCHTKHLGIDRAAANVLDRIPGLSVDEPQVPCCGMAGSFGYQADYYELSLDIGEDLFAQLRASRGDPVATGFSCRSQIRDGMDTTAHHPIELVEESMD